MLILDSFAAHDGHGSHIPDKPNQKFGRNKLHLFNRMQRVLTPHIVIRTQFDAAKCQQYNLIAQA